MPLQVGGFPVRVIPAQLDVSNTGKTTFGLTQSSADTEWVIVARDCFGNVRIRNDTITVTMIAKAADQMWPVGVQEIRLRPRQESVTCTLHPDDESCSTRPNDAGMMLTTVKWVEEHYSVTYSTTTSGVYSIDVTLAQECGDSPSAKWCEKVDPVRVPGSPFTVTVYAADLDVGKTWTSLTDRTRSLAGCDAPECPAVHERGGATPSDVDCGGCAAYYRAETRFSMPPENIQSCQASGCLSSAGDKLADGNILEVQLYDTHGNPRGSNFHDVVTLVVACAPTESQAPPFNLAEQCTNDASDPLFFPCGLNNRTLRHECPFLANLSGHHNLSFSIDSATYEDYTPSEQTKPWKAAGALPRSNIESIANTDVAVGPGKVNASLSVLYVEASHESTVCDAQQQCKNGYDHPNQPLRGDFAGFNAYQEQTTKDQWRKDYNGAPVAFKLDTFDSMGNRRYGLDTAIVQFSRADAIDSPSLMFFTKSIRNDTIPGFGTKLTHLYLVPDPDLLLSSLDRAYFGQRQHIMWPTAADYVYSILVGFPERGVWQAAAWVCDVSSTDFKACTNDTASRVPSSAATQPLDADQQQLQPISAADKMQLDKAQLDSAQLDKRDGALQLVICQQNAQHQLLLNVTRSKLNTFGTKAHMQTLNDTCLCKPGWFHWGHDGTAVIGGAECQACGVGTFQDQFGQLSCHNCSAGSYAACSTTSDITTPETDGNCPDQRPAATQCHLCRRSPAGKYKAGTYAWNTGQERCDDCPEGFKCDVDGMVYPVAGKGSWISPTLPKNRQTCTPKEACMGGVTTEHKHSGTFGQAAVAYEDLNHHEQQCFTKPWKRLPHEQTAAICPPELDPYTPHDDESIRKQWLAQGLSIPYTPHSDVYMHKKHDMASLSHRCDKNAIELSTPSDVVDCWPVIGATCSPGYIGEGCMTCCKNCVVDPKANTCWKGKDGTHNNPNNPECREIGTKIVTPNYFRHNTASIQGGCEPCPESDTQTRIQYGLMFLVGMIVIGPALMRTGDALKHAGEMTAPMMTIINFFQTISLFKALHIHWPATIKNLFKLVAGWIELLNFNIDIIHPEVRQRHSNSSYTVHNTAQLLGSPAFASAICGWLTVCTCCTVHICAFVRAAVVASDLLSRFCYHFARVGPAPRCVVLQVRPMVGSTEVVLWAHVAKVLWAEDAPQSAQHGRPGWWWWFG